MPNYRSIQEAAYRANMRLPELGLVHFTFGNASAVDRAAGVFAIKPSGVPYGELTPDKIVIVDFDNQVVAGELRPSSDTATHALLYREWSDIGGIVHTHSTYATSWAQAGRPVPLFGTTHADYLAGEVPCAPPLADDKIADDYEHQTGWQIVDHLRQLGVSPHDVSMILLGGHGPFTWGKDADEAVYHSAILEEIARMALHTLQLNPGATPLKDRLVRKHWERKHGASAYYGQS